MTLFQYTIYTISVIKNMPLECNEEAYICMKMWI